MFDFESLLSFLDFLARGESIRGEVIGREDFNSHGFHVIVDTCFTKDTGRYETAIKVNNNIPVIVEYYNNPTSAKEGHENWKTECEKACFSFLDVQTGEIFIYESDQ